MKMCIYDHIIHTIFHTDNTKIRSKSDKNKKRKSLTAFDSSALFSSNKSAQISDKAYAIIEIKKYFCVALKEE